METLVKVGNVAIINDKEVLVLVKQRFIDTNNVCSLCDLNNVCFGTPNQEILSRFCCRYNDSPGAFFKKLDNIALFDSRKSIIKLIEKNNKNLSSTKIQI